MNIQIEFQIVIVPIQTHYQNFSFSPSITLITPGLLQQKSLLIDLIAAFLKREIEA